MAYEPISTKVSITGLAVLPFIALFSSAHADWKSQREGLENTIASGDFRIFYNTSGHPASTDEFARNTLKKLVAADRFFSETLQLKRPLETKRYSAVKTIDVHILDLEVKKRGSAGDSIIEYNYRNGTRKLPALSIDLDFQLDKSNRTPEHELFHLYQYGYTYFKNRWYLEGLSRSTLRALKKNTYKLTRLPQTTSELSSLTKKSYDAESFWNRLLHLCDNNCNYPNRLIPIVSKEKTVKLGAYCSASALRKLLEELDRADDVAAKERNIDNNHWPEEEQRSEENNPYIFNGLRSFILGSCQYGNNMELKNFLAVLSRQ